MDKDAITLKQNEEFELEIVEGPEGWHLAPIPYGYQLHTEAPDKLGSEEIVFTILESCGQDGSTALIIVCTMIDGGNKVLFDGNVEGFDPSAAISRVLTSQLQEWAETRRKTRAMLADLRRAHECQ